MKRYLVFAYPAYYPSGGWGDFKAAFDTAEEAITFASNITSASGGKEVIDLETGEDIYTYTVADKEVFL